jgi:hypothetical protein
MNRTQALAFRLVVAAFMLAIWKKIRSLRNRLRRCRQG